MTVAILTHAQVTAIRTSGYTDRWWADKLRVRGSTVRNSRLGLTHKDNPTPPDTAPRDQTGCTFAIRSGQPQKARPARIRRSYFNYL